MYYKIDSGALYTANEAYNANYSLTTANYSEHSYPIDGWYWFDTLDAAMSFFSGTSDAVDAWQGRYILAGMAPVAAGPLSAYPGDTVLEQINAFVAANLSAPEQERFKGTKTWLRNDPMVASIGALLGLDDAMIDAWFESARAVQ